ncbi:hypothetical protein HK096_009582, partial [Nowakowskiella sp. JEL0078]
PSGLQLYTEIPGNHRPIAKLQDLIDRRFSFELLHEPDLKFRETTPDLNANELSRPIFENDLVVQDLEEDDDFKFNSEKTQFTPHLLFDGNQSENESIGINENRNFEMNASDPEYVSEEHAVNEEEVGQESHPNSVGGDMVIITDFDDEPVKEEIDETIFADPTEPTTNSEEYLATSPKVEVKAEVVDDEDEEVISKTKKRGRKPKSKENITKRQSKDKKKVKGIENKNNLESDSDASKFSNNEYGTDQESVISINENAVEVPEPDEQEDIKFEKKEFGKMTFDEYIQQPVESPSLGTRLSLSAKHLVSRTGSPSSASLPKFEDNETASISEKIELGRTLTGSFKIGRISFGKSVTKEKKREKTAMEVESVRQKLVSMGISWKPSINLSKKEEKSNLSSDEDKEEIEATPKAHRILTRSRSRLKKVESNEKNTVSIHQPDKSPTKRKLTSVEGS